MNNKKMLDINEIRYILDNLGYEVLNYKNEESFTLRRYGNKEPFKKIYDLDSLMDLIDT